MDARTVAGIPLYIDLAAPHGVSRRIADAAVDDDPSAVHRIADGVLRVAAHLDAGAVQIGAQRVPRRPRDLQKPLLRPGADESLPKAAGDQQRPGAVLDPLIQLAMIQL